jgi:hypothetical protein
MGDAGDWDGVVVEPQALMSTTARTVARSTRAE